MISALGRPFGLGMLYDRRSDKLILGKTLWSPDHLNNACGTISSPSTNSEVFTENAIEDKTSALDIEASLQLSFLSGLVSVEGAAKYLNDTKTSKRHSRVVLKYETTTELKQLTMEHLGTGKIQYPEVFDTDIATDVVVGILYGAKAFMVFDKKVSKDESLKEVHGNMEVLVKSLPGISVDGRGSVEITEELKKNTENMQCKMYGDFRTNESPTNYEDAVKIYKQLPSLIGENGEKAVPIKVYLCPLSRIDSKCQRMVREICADLVSKTTATQEHLQSVIAECNDLLREEACVLFPRLKKQLNSFMNSVQLYKVSLQKKIMSVLPKIRGGGAEESDLAKIIEEKETSPLSCSILECWLQEKKREIKRLQGIIHLLGETSIVIPEAVENELYDPSNEFMVCCTFKIACEEDEQVLKMDAYIKGDVTTESSENDSFKVEEKSTHQKVRQSLRHFKTLKAVNKENHSVKFLATDDPLSRNYGGNTGAFLYFYEDGELVNKDLCSYVRPNNLKGVATGESTLQLLWNDSAGSNAISYKVQYKDETSRSSVEVKSSGEGQQAATLTGLQPATNYTIQVCAVQGIIVSEYSEAISVTTKPASPPGKPQLNEATCDSITIGFTKPQRLGKDVKVINYKVEWSSDASWSTTNVLYTEDSTPTFTLKQLDPLTSYFFKVSANCGSGKESNTSPSSDAFTTFAQIPMFHPKEILGLCELIEPPEEGKPAVYALPLTSVHEDRDRQLRKYEIRIGKNATVSSSYNTPNKVIMMVGSTGSGKTTTVNAMINHILGVKWEDSFRLKMINEDSSNQETENIGNQTCSQTQFVTCYTLPHLKGFKVPYTLTLVDTPGFGDTRGIKQDEKITDQIRTFFNTSGAGGIDHIDAICFLAQASIPRLTHTQRYVFDRILSMFGKDIKKNISVLFTFADGQKPQALSSLQEAGILDNESAFFKFNNSALFVDNSKRNDDDNFDRMFWLMGIKSFEKFFNNLSEMESRSLVLTKEVLQERAHLEVRVSGLQEKINCGINTLSRLQQEQRIFNQHAVEVNANKNFKYKVKEEKRVKVHLQIGTYTTNCTTCNYTCHYPCSIPRSEDKEGCAAMTNGSCDECPNRCHWSRHVNDQYRMDTEYVEVEKEYDSKKTLYQKAVEGQSNVEALICQLQNEFDSTQDIVLSFVAEMQRGIQRLSEIALKKDPLQQVDYLDLLIQSEEMQAKPGFKERVRSLHDTRNRAEQINKMAKPGYDPWKEYRENEETRRFLQRDNSRQKKGFVRRFVSAVANVIS